MSNYLDAYGIGAAPLRGSWIDAVRWIARIEDCGHKIGWSEDGLLDVAFE
jgi:hypothetical protein